MSVPEALTGTVCVTALNVAIINLHSSFRTSMSVPQMNDKKDLLCDRQCTIKYAPFKNSKLLFESDIASAVFYCELSETV